jgi:hypothetical protein
MLRLVYKQEREIMENGTYQKTTDGLVKLNATTGYWVGIEEIDLSNILDSVEVGEFVGFWTDPENGKVWIDRVLHFTDLTMAIEAGKLNEQKAIYDIANETEIYLEGK